MWIFAYMLTVVYLCIYFEACREDWACPTKVPRELKSLLLSLLLLVSLFIVISLYYYLSLLLSLFIIISLYDYLYYYLSLLLSLFMQVTELINAVTFASLFNTLERKTP